MCRPFFVFARAFVATYPCRSTPTFNLAGVVDQACYGFSGREGFRYGNAMAAPGRFSGV
ncbi:hypothetical protein X566_17390 [Afipia sp. P52-10]|nr:hypothetical protein X566_17390 [Afipia sp. P52-10]